LKRLSASSAQRRRRTLTRDLANECVVGLRIRSAFCRDEACTCCVRIACVLAGATSAMRYEPMIDQRALLEAVRVR
jgi:hypothetical protein